MNEEAQNDASSGDRCSPEEAEMQIMTIRHIKGKISQALENRGKIISVGIKDFPMFLCYIDNNVYTLLFNNTETKKFVGPREVLKHILQRVLKVDDRRHISVTSVFFIESGDEPLVLFFERNGKKLLPFTTMACWEESPEEASIRGMKETLGLTMNSCSFVKNFTEINEYGDSCVFNIFKIEKYNIVKFTNKLPRRVDLVGFIRLSKINEIEISAETIIELKKCITQQKQTEA